MKKKVLKEHPIKILVALLCILLFAGLKIWNDVAPLSTHDWNKKEISRIKVSDPEDFTFAVFGDNKGNYSVFEPLLREIDQSKEIAFAIDVGDLVNDGTRGQYRRFLHQVPENLNIPLVAATGNHDIYKDSANYRQIFGPPYYAFQVGQNYFIVLDATTEAGFDQAEREWLEDELQKAQSFQARFVFLHVPLLDPRGNGFNKCLPEKDGKDLLDLFRRYQVTHVFASHIHGYFSGVWEGVPYTVTGGAGGGLQGSDPQHFFYHYMKVHVSRGKVEMVARHVNPEGTLARFYDIIEDNLVAWGLVLVAGVLLFPLVLSIQGKHGS